MKSIFHELATKCSQKLRCVRRQALLLAVVVSPLVTSGQTLTINNGVQTYNALTNTTVTLTGWGELRITGTNNPISGCTIKLTSPDAWFFLPNLRPSVVSASYLSQVLVNGSVAVAGSNCRLDQYAMGSVIIPQPSGFTPLQVFSGPNFAGASSSLGLYTYYTNTALGAMNRNIGSFTLKRGYMATFAQNADGTGASQVYVAQDSDLAVGVAATNLDRKCSFMRVFPWRYTGKKGWGGGDGATEITTPLWWYDWGNSATSTTDREYIPMKWSSGSGTSSINNKQNITAVLGYNEPDSSSQANMTVAQAIADWPNMMRWGLRVGAPAVSDSGVSGQGLDWLYAFMTQANSLGYRVDFIPIHYYKCGWSTTQFSNYLAQIYQVTGKPIWVTEWNNGASWCSSGLPGSQAADATAISSDIAMLESAPFVERYAIYQWFDPSTYLNLITTNTPPTLTPAGVVYANQQSALAYTQTLPPGGGRSIAQLEFETNALDSSGYGNNGFAMGAPAYAAGHSGQAVVLDGTNSFIRLPPNVANSTSFSFAAWVYWNGGAHWQRIFDFGNDTSHYLFLTPGSGSGTLRFAINNGSGEQIIETAGLASGQWQHVAVTINGNNARLYTNGVLAASSSSFTISPASFNPNLNYLGKSQFSADPLFSGNLDEVQIADYAFTPTQIAALLTNIPPQFTTNFMDYGVAAPFQTYTTNITGMATDPNPGDTLTYSKASGPAWLNVTADGILTGTPGSGDGGTNYFTVRATDTAGASAFTVAGIYVPIVYASGTWTADTDGTWSDTNNWGSGLIANGAGFTADFSTLNITSNRTVIMDGPRSLGALKFGDTSGIQNWALISDGDILTLDTASSTAPSIVVNQNTATIAAPLVSAYGLAKTGAGTLVLSGANSLSGTIYIDRNSNTANDGIVRAANPSALLNVTNLQIRNNNSGSSTLQLDGSNGNITAPSSVALAGRNVNIAAIENLSGSNTLSGGVSINVGGGYYVFQSDAGVLGLGGILTSIAGGNRTFTFQGNGDFYISGSIQNGAATNGLTKIGPGRLTLAGGNTYTNITTVSGGTLLVNGSTSTGPLIAGSSATLGGTGTIRGAVTIQSGATLAPGSSVVIGTLTVGNTVALQAGSFTRMKISKTAMTNDVLKVSGVPLTYGGTLVVTNLAGMVTTGDSFKLFSAPSYTGAFSSVSPATPGIGLLWNTNNLTVNGTLFIALGNVNLQLGSVFLTGTNLIFSGAGGAAGAGFSVLASTNLTLPLTNWNVMATESFDENGNFSFTNNLAPNAPQQFFSVRIP